MEGGRGRRNNSISALAWTTTGGASFRPPPAPKKGDSVRQKSSHTNAIQKASPHSRDKQKSFAATHHRSQAGGTLRTKNFTCLLNGGRLSESHEQQSSLRMLLLGWSRVTFKANPIGFRFHLMLIWDWGSASSHWRLGIIMLKVVHLRLGPWHLYEGTQKSLSFRCSSGIKAPMLIWDSGRRTFTRVPKNSNSH